MENYVIACGEQGWQPAWFRGKRLRRSGSWRRGISSKSSTHREVDGYLWHRWIYHPPTIRWKRNYATPLVPRSAYCRRNRRCRPMSGRRLQDLGADRVSRKTEKMQTVFRCIQYIVNLGSYMFCTDWPFMHGLIFGFWPSVSKAAPRKG